MLNVYASCNKDTAFQDQSLLACKLSLDEMGVLFELPSIGSGDKDSVGAGEQNMGNLNDLAASENLKRAKWQWMTRWLD